MGWSRCLSRREKGNFLSRGCNLMISSRIQSCICLAFLAAFLLGPVILIAADGMTDYKARLVTVLPSDQELPAGFGWKVNWQVNEGTEGPYGFARVERSWRAVRPLQGGHSRQNFEDVFSVRCSLYYTAYIPSDRRFEEMVANQQATLARAGYEPFAKLPIAMVRNYAAPSRSRYVCYISFWKDIRTRCEISVWHDLNGDRDTKPDMESRWAEAPGFCQRECERLASLIFNRLGKEKKNYPLIIVVHGVGHHNKGWSESLKNAWHIPAEALQPGNDAWVEVTYDPAKPHQPTLEMLFSEEWVSYVSDRLKEALERARREDRKVILVAHSWGTVMTKLAMDGGSISIENTNPSPGRETSAVRRIIPRLSGQIDSWITLASPLGRGGSNQYMSSGFGVPIFSLPLAKPAQVKGEWANFYDIRDKVSEGAENLSGSANINRDVSGLTANARNPSPPPKQSKTGGGKVPNAADGGDKNKGKFWGLENTINKAKKEMGDSYDAYGNTPQVHTAIWTNPEVVSYIEKTFKSLTKGMPSP